MTPPVAQKSKDALNESTNGQANKTTSAKELLERIKQLEQKLYGTKEHPVDEFVRRARNHIDCDLLKKNPPCLASSTSWKWVPSHYYTLSLSERAKILQAQSTQQLCKSMLMENRAPNAPKDCKDRTNSRFYLVVVQYDAAINTKKLESEVRGLRSFQSGTRLSTTDFEFRMASEEDNDRITGYSHNSVTPFGLLDSTVPIVLSKSILATVPSFIWMGGGHVHLKLGMAVHDFIQALDALVLDVSDSR